MLSARMSAEGAAAISRAAPSALARSAATPPIAGPPLKTDDAESRLAALGRGLGVTALSCFVATPTPCSSGRPAPVHLHGEVWGLTQEAMRHTGRVRLFTELISQRLARRDPRLAGAA